MKEWVANHYCGKGIGRKLTFIRLVSFDVGSSQMWQDFGLLHVIVLCIWTIGFVFRRFLKISSFGGKEIDFWFESSYKLIIFLTGINTLRHSYTRNLYFYLMCTTAIEDQTEAEKVFMPVVLIYFEQTFININFNYYYHNISLVSSSFSFFPFFFLCN